MNIPQEIEGKWLVRDLKKLEARLLALGAFCVQERCYENNLRFDTQERQISKKLNVLRLRQDDDARLTFKGKLDMDNGVGRRAEIEFSVSDFELAKQFLEALDYSVVFRYEKYRTTYVVGSNHVMLDEMPYGDFIEIEGSSGEAVRVLSEQLKLDWDARAMTSYTGLFSTYCTNTGQEIRDLTFDDFVGVTVAPQELGLRIADTI